jgi:hypothetical protein
MTQNRIVAMAEIPYTKKNKEALKHDLTRIIRDEFKFEFITTSEDYSLDVYWTPKDQLTTVHDWGTIERSSKNFRRIGLIRVNIYVENPNEWPQGFFEKMDGLKEKYKV